MHSTLTHFISLKFYRYVPRQVISIASVQDVLPKLRHQHFVPRPSQEHRGRVACVSTEIPLRVLDHTQA